MRLPRTVARGLPALAVVGTAWALPVLNSAFGVFPHHLVPTLRTISLEIGAQLPSYRDAFVYTFVAASTVWAVAVGVQFLLVSCEARAPKLTNRTTGSLAALQTIPVIAVAAPLGLLMRPGFLYIVCIGLFIALPPLLITTGRLLKTIPPSFWIEVDWRGRPAFAPRFWSALRLLKSEILSLNEALSPLAVVGVTVAEYLRGTSGLGFMTYRAVAAVDMPQLYSASLLAASLGGVFLVANTLMSSLFLPSQSGRAE